MKQTLIALLLLFLCSSANTQILYTAATPHVTGAPSGAPSAQGSRFRVDVLTGKFYGWSPNSTSWLPIGLGIDETIGSIPPAYTPGIFQSTFAVNDADVLYRYRSGAWHTVAGGGGGTTYTAGSGIFIRNDSIFNIGDLSATNELQTIDTLSIVSNTLRLSLSSDGQPFKSVSLSPYLDNTDAQTLSLASQSLSISGGNSVSLPIINVSAGTGVSVSIASGNATVTNTGDLSNTNELQTISYDDDVTVTLSNGGGSVDLSPLRDGNGIYSGSNTIPPSTFATMSADALNWNTAVPRMVFNDIGFYESLFGDGFQVFGFENNDDTNGTSAFFGFKSEDPTAFYINTTDGSALTGAYISPTNVSFSSGGNMGLSSTAFTVNATPTSEASNGMSFNLNAGKAIFTDNSSTKSGLEYFADYSSGYTNRSLVDKAYVTAAISTVPSGSGSANRAAFWTGTTSLSSSANFQMVTSDSSFRINQASPNGADLAVKDEIYLDRNSNDNISAIMVERHGFEFLEGGNGENDNGVILSRGGKVQGTASSPIYRSKNSSIRQMGLRLMNNRITFYDNGTITSGSSFTPTSVLEYDATTGGGTWSLAKMSVTSALTVASPFELTADADSRVVFANTNDTRRNNLNIWSGGTGESDNGIFFNRAYRTTGSGSTTYTSNNSIIRPAGLRIIGQKIEAIGSTSTVTSGSTFTPDVYWSTDIVSKQTGFGTTSPTSKIHIAGTNGYDQLRLANTYTPSSSSDTNGNTGDVTWDDSYIYIKTSGGWKRSALSSF